MRSREAVHVINKISQLRSFKSPRHTRRRKFVRFHETNHHRSHLAAAESVSGASVPTVFEVRISAVLPRHGLREDPLREESLSRSRRRHHRRGDREFRRYRVRSQPAQPSPSGKKVQENEREFFLGKMWKKTESFPISPSPTL
ncbi:hypothetical protein BRARA_I01927 [Brassica rapa]|uniref:Uncharacterized protein n=1 Tax=Brassica campestris TaxID=3711 RepID=A0A397XV04_BRACM|nr:hypothetical protein BRARA_I01927 [Brassica rapa]